MCYYILAITSWQIERKKKSGNSDIFYFLGLQNTADSDCSHEIKRCLLLGRETMINLDSTFKGRNVTLLIKVHIIKAMVFPVVMYGCESWIKKAQCWRIDDFELWYWRRPLRVPWTAGRSNQSILKEINPENSLEGMMLKLKWQHFGHLIQRAQLIGKDPDAGEDWRHKEMGTTEDEMVG